jgi:outer membrane receptor protein involved in Fe transport
MKHHVASLAVVALASASPVAAQTAAPKTLPAKATPSSVEGIVVTAERPQTQSLVDRTVYTVNADLQATAGSAAEVLNNLPSVNVDADGALSLRGDPNVTVLVDGKPSAQFSGATRGLSLLQFPANEIDRIEVMANPPAQYRAEGSGGVINIITKKTRRDGFSGSAQASVGDYGRYVLGLNGSYNIGRLKASGGIGLRHDVKERLTSSDRVEVDPATGAPVESHQRIDEHFHRLMPSVKGGLDYEFNDRQSAGLSFSHRELTGNRYFDQNNASGAPGQAPSGLSSRHSDGHEWSMDGAEGLHFDQKLWRPGETLSLALQRSVTRERERYAYRNGVTLPAGPPTFDDLHLSLDLIKTELSADYDLPMAHDREVKLGYDLEDDRNAFDNVGDTLASAGGPATINPAVTNHFRYRQQVNAAYGQYETPLGPWRLQAGLRVEATHVATLQITGALAGGRDDVAAYPSLHLDRSLGDDGKLTASASRRVTRPDPEALNPFADHQDIHNLRAGNPDLRPQDTWSYELGYLYSGVRLNYGATAYYRRDKNSVTDVIRPISADVVLATKMNLPLSQSGGVVFTAGGKLGSRLSYNLSGDLFAAEIDATALGATGTKSTTGLNLKASLDYRPTAKDTAQISVSRTDKRLTPQGEISAINLVNLGYRRQIRPDLAAVVTVTDLFDGQRQQRLISTPQLRDDFLRHQLGRVAFVGVVYTFGAPAKAKPSNFEYEP